MKKNRLFIFLALVASGSMACGQPSDFINLEGIEVLPVYHATLELKWDGKYILFDPSVNDQQLKAIRKPDIVFLTDIHPDHLNLDNLAKLNLEDVPIVAPQAVADKLPPELRKHLMVIGNGEKKKWGSIGFEAIPMYNLSAERKSFHTKGRGNGYVLTLGSRRIYISGDTEDIPEMRSLKDIDLAFVCMNLPYTMTVEQAADGVSAFKPKTVVPYHYRGTSGLSDLEKFRKLLNQRQPETQVYLLNFYP